MNQLIGELEKAEKSVVIQSPYLIMPEGGIDFFKQLIMRGVRVQINTNSLASTDNLQAFSGYAKQRKEILAAGIEVYEFKPNPAIQKDLIDRYEALKQEVLAHLLDCVKSRGQTVAVARMAEPHRGLRSLFRVETCAEWLREEAGISAQQAHDAIANIKSFGVWVADRLNQIAANPRWMLGYAAASFKHPDVLVYGTDGMDPMGVKAAHRYMEVLSERCCVIHLSPRLTDQSCPPTARCVQLEDVGGGRC